MKCVSEKALFFKKKSAMNLFNPKLTLVPLLCICIVRAAFCQSVTQSEKKTFGFFYNKASQQLNQNLDSAYIYATKALDVAYYNQRWSAYFLLGLIAKKKKQHSESIILYKRAIELTKEKSNKLYIQSNLANDYFEQGLYKQSLYYARLVLAKTQGKNKQYLYNTYGIIAKCHSKQDAIDSAKHYFAKAIAAIPPTHTKVMGGFLAAKGDMYAENGKTTEALRLYKQSLEHETKPYVRAETCLKIAEAHTKAKRYARAKPYITQAQTTSNQMHIRAKALKLQAMAAYNAKDLPALNTAHQDFKRLLNARGKLIGEDRTHYYNMYEVIYHQNEILKQSNAKKEKLVVSIEYWGMWLLVVGAVGLALFVVYRNPEFLGLTTLPETETIQPVDTKKDIRAIDVKYSLSVSHKSAKIRSLDTKSEKEELFDFLRSSKYRPPKT